MDKEKLKKVLYESAKNLIDISRLLYEYDKKISNVLLTISRDLIDDCEKLIGSVEEVKEECNIERTCKEEKSFDSSTVEKNSKMEYQDLSNVDSENIEEVIQKYIEDVKKELGIE